MLVSSTAVMPSSERPPLDDETTPAAPSDGPGRMLVAAEEAFHERIPHGTVLRLSGLYGGSSTRLLDQVRDGRIDDPHRWTNRIHREDAAAAVVHLLTMDARPDGLYLGTDDEPAQLGDVAAYLAERLGAPAPPPADPAQGHGKRLSNARLRATGWAPTRPSYREGYAATSGGTSYGRGKRLRRPTTSAGSAGAPSSRSSAATPGAVDGREPLADGVERRRAGVVGAGSGRG